MTAPRVPGHHDLVAALRPGRADAARNFDAILATARRLFNEHDAGTSMPQIAAAAGVGVATLYRNFPSREALIEAVYVTEVEELCSFGDSVTALHADEALDRWLELFLRYMMSKRILAESLNQTSSAYQDCRTAIYAAGAALLSRAQAEGTARTNVDIDTAMRFIMAISLGVYTGDAQRNAILGFALAGLHVTNAQGE
jgi:AcrR family transcriptional regulator